jgi:hypothetical protein
MIVESIVLWFAFWAMAAWSLLAWLNDRHLRAEIRYWRSNYYRVSDYNRQLYAELLEKETRP